MYLSAAFFFFNQAPKNIHKSNSTQKNGDVEGIVVILDLLTPFFK